MSAQPFPCDHHKPKNLPYLTAHLEAEARMERGEEQTQCPVCRRWFWPEEMGAKK